MDKVTKGFIKFIIILTSIVLFPYFYILLNNATDGQLHTFVNSQFQQHFFFFLFLLIFIPAYISIRISTGSRKKNKKIKNKRVKKTDKEHTNNPFQF